MNVPDVLIVSVHAQYAHTARLEDIEGVLIRLGEVESVKKRVSEGDSE